VARLKCTLICHSNSHHLQQVYTGFSLLHKLGIVDLRQICVRARTARSCNSHHLNGAMRTHLSAVLNDGVRIHYDLHDSWEIDEECLSESDHYFKRSLSSKLLPAAWKKSGKIHALGLYYPVYSAGIDWFAMRRAVFLDSGRKRRERMLNLGLLNMFRDAPNSSNVWLPPHDSAAPAILFMTTAWDPHDDPLRSKDKVRERIRMNEVRAKCIELLRKEFKDRFYGGFIYSDFAKKSFPKCLVADNRLTSKRRYLSLLARPSICVATTGLHGSIGAKFAEYVAFSKAIVSERLNYEVPGSFRRDQNYLEFGSPEECVVCVARLLSDADLRHHMMVMNSRYYHRCVRPDSLVLNSIMEALSTSRGSHSLEVRGLRSS